MKRLALFAHFDAQAQIRRHILYHLEQLRLVCDEIVFVSTSPLAQSEIAKVSGLCSQVLLKENKGMDFAMWRHAMRHVDVKTFDELVLDNSSVFGPIDPLAPIFDKMNRTAADVWAMTDNVELDWHLQSYFVVFKPRVLHSPEFEEFWNGVLEYRNKTQIIRSYEVGLTTFLIESGFRAVPLAPVACLPPYPFWRRILGAIRGCNPTCGYPLELLRMGMPFVKVELLLDNPLRVDLGPVYEEMRRRGYDMSLIEFDRPPRKRNVSTRL